MVFFYVFAALQIFLSYKSLRGGIEYLNFFKEELAKPESEYTPFATIIVPCRGKDFGLIENLTSLFQQNYPEYEVVFVVDSKEDESFPILEDLSNKNVEKSKIVVAGNSLENGQKIHNLRTALLEVSKESEVFVFVDSDARPNQNWLKSLVSPLEDKSVGCSTGYRWFIQENGGLATALQSVWNASIASNLGKNTGNNFCWGGSTAIRRTTFDKCKVAEKWKKVLSDDFALANILKKAGLGICFVPNCLIATIEDCTFKDLLEFTTRQMKITRVYSPSHFKLSLIGSIIFIMTFWVGVLLLFFASHYHFWAAILFLIIVFLLGVLKSWIRIKAVKLVLGDYEKQLNWQLMPHLALWVVTPFLYLYNNINALLSRQIVWRGITYKMESPDKTTIIDREV